MAYTIKVGRWIGVASSFAPGWAIGQHAWAWRPEQVFDYRSTKRATFDQGRDPPWGSDIEKIQSLYWKKSSSILLKIVWLRGSKFNTMINPDIGLILIWYWSWYWSDIDWYRFGIDQDLVWPDLILIEGSQREKSFAAIVQRVHSAKLVLQRVYSAKLVLQRVHMRKTSFTASSQGVYSAKRGLPRVHRAKARILIRYRSWDWSDIGLKYWSDIDRIRIEKNSFYDWKKSSSILSIRIRLIFSISDPQGTPELGGVLGREGQNQM